MRPRDLAQETWSALSANAGRSALTILGIVIGIAAVITMNAIIGGVRVAQADAMGASATRIINITLAGIDNVTPEDVDEIAASIPGYEYILPSVEGKSPTIYKTKQYEVSLTSMTKEYIDAHGTRILQGRAPTDAECENGAMVMLLDQYAVRNLYGSTDAPAVGQSLRLGNDDYQIIGVVDKIGMSAMTAQYSKTTLNALMPFATMRTRITGNAGIDFMEGVALEGVDVMELSQRTTTYLCDRYKADDMMLMDPDSPGTARMVQVLSNTAMQQEVDATMASFQMIMVIVSSISLLVGGIGIMNMMLTNVTERIREIGLRKALGARRGDITSQFILESVTLCLVGGFIGVVLGLLGAVVLSGVVGDAMSSMTFGGEFKPIINADMILNAVTVCVVTGLIFGWYPAQRAARLDPVESLNHQ